LGLGEGGKKRGTLPFVEEENVGRKEKKKKKKTHLL